MRQKRRWAFLLTAVMAISMLFSGMTLAGINDPTATPSNAQHLKRPGEVVISTAADMLLNLEGEEGSDYAKIKDLTLHIIDPEEKTVTVDELSTSAVRIFVFGDIDRCGNTKNIIKLLTFRLKGANVELYYLDVKGRNASQIISAKEGIVREGIPCYLCEDKDQRYNRAVASLFGGGGTMPFIFIVGKEQETLYLDNYSDNLCEDSYDIYVDELVDSIIEAYPEEAPYNIPSQIYMYPDTQRRFPIIHKEGYRYISSDPEIATVEENLIFAHKPGTVQLTVSIGDTSREVTLHVIESKEDYSNEWEVLKIVNRERIKVDLPLLSTMESFQKAANLRAYELGEIFAHVRPDGSSVGSAAREVGIYNLWSSAENIAGGQKTPAGAMSTWMNSQGHKANILSENQTHVGVGYQEIQGSSLRHYWVQYFGGCNGDYTDISLVVNSHVPAEITEGGTLNELDYELSLVCSECGETRMPVIDEMCQFDPNEVGDQEVTVSYLDWSDTFPLTVNKKVLVQSISVTPDTLKMAYGETASLSAKISPANAQDQSITWHSTNPSVASVDQDGKVSAVASGTAEIYCVAKDDGEAVSNRCTVTVVILVNRITLDRTELSMVIGDKEFLEAAVYPADADNQSVTWHSTDPSVASVDSQGIVTAVGQGIAQIYCEAQDESHVTSGYCTVNVRTAGLVQPEKKLVEKITIEPETVTMKKGETAFLSRNMYPGDADNQAVTWHSTEDSVAKVDSDGVITAVGEGTAEIYCVSQDEGKVSSNRCKVTVTASRPEQPEPEQPEPGQPEPEQPEPEQPEPKLVQSLTVSPDSLSLSRGGTRTLSVSAMPEDADNKAVTWHSTNPSVAVVDETGTVKAMSKGTAEIYCVAQDGSNVESNHCAVSVISGGGSGGGSSSGGSGGSGGGSGSGGSGGSGGGSSSSKGQGPVGGTNTTGNGALPSYVVRGSWTQGEDGSWSFTDSQGNRYVNAWAAVENPYANLGAGQQAFDWFRFDENGKMVVGWYQDPADGRWYYLSPVSDGTLGRMITGWYVIDGFHYYFNPNSDGSRGRMYANETTPDGYYVDGSGRWTR